MAQDGKPLLGHLQPLLGLQHALEFMVMTGPRDNKNNKGRISRSTRAIFWENFERAVNALPDAPTDAARIRWLIKHALVSRTQAQRMLKFGTNPDDEQAPNIDTLACIAQAFGVTAAQFLTQGCRFNEKRKETTAAEQRGEPDSKPEILQRPRGRGNIER